MSESRFADPPVFEVVGFVAPRESGPPPLIADAYRSGPAQARAPKGSPGGIGGRWIDMVRGVLDNIRGGDGGDGDNNQLVEHVPQDQARRNLALTPKAAAKLRGSYVSGHRVDDAGEWTPEAVADQDALLEGTMVGVEPYGPDEEKVVYFAIGGPGSGKGSLTEINADQVGFPTNLRRVDDMTGELDMSIEHPSAVVLDADGNKVMLAKTKEMREMQRASGILNDPSAPGGNWAGESHEESSYMNKLAYARALERGLPIVYDGTGDGGIESVRDKVEQARKAGYKVVAGGMYLEPTEGLTRAIGRAGGTGRNVGKRVQADTYADIPNTFKQAMDEGLFDSVTFLDNNGVKKGEKAKKIFEYKAGGGIRILDQAAWDRFQSSGDRLPDLPDED